MSDDTDNVMPTSGSHDRRGKFAAGNNARAEVKAKRQRGMARFIAQNTNNGIEMAQAALNIMRDATHRDRMKAIDWLTVRMCGKPPETVEVTGKDGAPLNPLANFTPEQLLALATTKPEGEK